MSPLSCPARWGLTVARSIAPSNNGGSTTGTHTLDCMISKGAIPDGTCERHTILREPCIHATPSADQINIDVSAGSASAGSQSSQFEIDHSLSASSTIVKTKRAVQAGLVVPSGLQCKSHESACPVPGRVGLWEVGVRVRLERNRADELHQRQCINTSSNMDGQFHVANGQ